MPDDPDAMAMEELTGGATLRLSETKAQANVPAVLQLCGAGRLRCSDKTHRPTAATVNAVAEVLSGGDF